MVQFGNPVRGCFLVKIQTGDSLGACGTRSANAIVIPTGHNQSRWQTPVEWRDVAWTRSRTWRRRKFVCRSKGSLVVQLLRKEGLGLLSVGVAKGGFVRWERRLHSSGGPTSGAKQRGDPGLNFSLWGCTAVFIDGAVTRLRELRSAVSAGVNARVLC